MIDEPKSMKEIHDIMEDLHRKREAMTKEGILIDIQKGAKELAIKYGLKIENVGRLIPR